MTDNRREPKLELSLRNIPETLAVAFIATAMIALIFQFGLDVAVRSQPELPSAEYPSAFHMGDETHYISDAQRLLYVVLVPTSYVAVGGFIVSIVLIILRARKRGL